MAPHNTLTLWPVIPWRLLILLGGLMTAGASWAVSDLESAQRAVRMQQFEQAYTLYLEAAQAGNLEAQYQLSVLYAQGRGTRQNDSEARRWLEQAANASHPAAQYLLAQQLQGSDPERARSLLTASADQGYRAAQNQLKRLGTSPGPALSAPSDAQWFGAARKGDVPALAEIIAQGGDLHSTDSAGRTALVSAVNAGHAPAVTWLLEQGLDVNHVDAFGLSAATVAIQANQPQLLQQLLQAGSDLKQTLSNGDNLLHYALRLRRDTMAVRLMQAGVNINQRNHEGWTPLDLAESRNNPRALAALQQRHAQKGARRAERQPQDLEAIASRLSDYSRLPPVATAVVNSNVPLLRKLIKEDPQRLYTTLPDDSNLLVLAVKQNRREVVETLLELGLSPDSPGHNGSTPLQVAAGRGLDGMVSLLLNAGADPRRANTAKKDAVLTALEEQQEGIASRLLDSILGAHNTARRADIQAQQVPIDRYLLTATQYHMNDVLQRLLPYTQSQGATDDQRRNALWFAAHEGNALLVEKLLGAGVSAKQADIYGRTPFFMAVNSDCRECAQLLAPHSDINQTTNTGNTPLTLAASRGSHAMTAWLLQRGAEIEVRNERGNTAVMEAVIADSMPVVRLLIDARANVTRKNRHGASALDMARNVSPEMFELVRSATVLGIF